MPSISDFAILNITQKRGPGMHHRGGNVTRAKDVIPLRFLCEQSISKHQNAPKGAS